VSTGGRSRIEGAGALEETFGYWPTFHDAEVLALLLDRGHAASDSQQAVPTLEADVYAFEITDQVGDDGRYRLDKHIIVTFRFYGMDNLIIRDFNHLNTMHGIGLRDVSDRQLERLKWDIRFAGSLRLTASFLCERIEIVSTRRIDGPPR